MEMDFSLELVYTSKKNFFTNYMIFSYFLINTYFIVGLFSFGLFFTNIPAKDAFLVALNWSAFIV